MSYDDIRLTSGDDPGDTYVTHDSKGDLVVVEPSKQGKITPLDDYIENSQSSNNKPAQNTGSSTGKPINQSGSTDQAHITPTGSSSGKPVLDTGIDDGTGQTIILTQEEAQEIVALQRDAGANPCAKEAALRIATQGISRNTNPEDYVAGFACAAWIAENRAAALAVVTAAQERRDFIQDWLMQPTHGQGQGPVFYQDTSEPTTKDVRIRNTINFGIDHENLVPIQVALDGALGEDLFSSIDVGLDDPVDFQPGIINGLAQALLDRRLDVESTLRLIEQARIEVEEGWSFSPSSAALYALAYADAQGANWVQWEDSNAVSVIYFGGSGAFSEYGNVPGGGNCTNLVSMALLAGGAAHSNVWNLGDPDDRHTDPNVEGSRSGALYEDYYAGSYNEETNVRAFTGVSDFNAIMGPWDQVASISPDIDVEYLGGYNVLTNYNYEPDKYDAAFNALGVGDLIVSRDTVDSTSDHISMVVGWGPPEGGAGQTFYPNIEVAQENGVDTSTWVPYIIDHGGHNPQNYPRPWTGGITTSENQTVNPEILINFINLEPEDYGNGEP